VRALGQIATCAAILLATMSLGACGGSSDPSQAVARVGNQPITKSTLAHWTAILRGAAWATPGRVEEHALARKVLSLLIAFQWLIGEAARRGISITEFQSRQRIDVILGRTFPGAIPELRQFLKPTGETAEDLKLQARAQLAEARLRAMAIAGVPAPTEQQIAAYYAQHKTSFVVPEHREARFANTKSRAATLKMKREVEAGKSLTSPAQRKVGELFTGATVPPQNEYETAIDSAKPHTVAGPFKIGNDYWLYEVVKVTPARQKTLAEVSTAIAHKLTSEHRHEAEAAFVKGWSAYWSPRTDCSSGYVVPGCKPQHSSVGGVQGLPSV
jgi:parvulin-like peptidyl-prolyl isomerase